MRTTVGLMLAATVVATSAQQQTPPQFRAGVEVTRIEVTVLDKRTRAPIKGLTADDFVVRVNGRVQPIVSLAEVTVPGVTSAAAPGMAEAARDVTSNELTAPRIFVLIMSDAVGGMDPYYRATGKAIAHRFIDQLGPEDLASVIFVRDNRPAQDLTQDRVLLRRAVDEYRPLDMDPRQATDMTTAVLLRTIDFLRPMSGYRRAVVFVTPLGLELNQSYLKDYYLAATFHESHVGAGTAEASSSLIPVYPFSAQGLRAPTGRDISQLDPKGIANPLRMFDTLVDTLRRLADLTGGHATVATNAPADRVPDMFNELSSYYALAYEQTDPADGRLRRLDVQVTRPDAMVLSSRLVLTPAAGAATPTGRTGLHAALASPVAMGALPLRLAPVPLAVPGAREHAVAMTLGLPQVDAAEQFRVRVLVYDGEGRRQMLDTARIVDLPQATGADGSELVIRASLRPGRYNVRVATERASDGVAGTVHATIDVPDFARETLSLSGVAIGRGEGPRIGGRQEIEGLLPFAPTAVRAFDASDRVGALLRVHQGSNRPAAVTTTTSIADSMGAELFTRSDAFEPAAFANGAAEHRFEMPLADLPPGTYLLRFVAMAGKATAQREVRFSIR